MRRRHKLQVSTFPFLAVLLCAMGSLILLLLVLDRRARSVARAKALRSAQQVVAEEVRAEASRRSEWERRRKTLHEQLVQQDRDVVAQAKSVQEQTTATAKARAIQQREERQLQERLESESLGLAHWHEELTTTRAEAERQTKEATISQEALARLTSELRQLEGTLQDLKALRQRQQQMHSLVPYRGKHGDNRRPLYIECAAGEVIFHPERFVLRGPSLSASGIRSEIERRLAMRALGSNKPAESAYLLMLVRPDGITTYYQTVAALRGLKIDFGYEFVDRQWILDFPEDDDSPGKQSWMTAEKTDDGRIVTPSSRKPAGIGSDTQERFQGRSQGVVFGPGRQSAGSPWRPVLESADGSRTGSQGTNPGVFPTPYSPDSVARPEYSKGVASGGLNGSLQNSRATTPTAPGTLGSESIFGTAAPAARPSSSSDLQGSAAASLEDSARATAPDSQLLRKTGALPAQAARNQQSQEETFEQRFAQDTASATIGPPRAAAPALPGPKIPGEQALPNVIPSSGASERGSSGNSSTGESQPPAPQTSEQNVSDPNPTNAGDPKARQTTDPLARFGPRSGPRKLARVTPLGPGLLTGNRDWIIPIECTGDTVILLPSGQRISTASLIQGSNGNNPLLEAVQLLIRRRQATVHPGELPFRPIIRFQVRPEGLRSYYLAYPALEPLHVSMTRENQEPEEDPKAASGNRWLPL